MAEKLKATETERSLTVARSERDLSQTARAPSDNIAAAISNPGLTPAKILALQRSVGNRAVLHMLATSLPSLHSAPSAFPTIQTKLVVGAAGDQYEQEADRVADQVMRMPAPERTIDVQRARPDKEDRIDTKPLATAPRASVQRQAEDDGAPEAEESFPEDTSAPPANEDQDVPVDESIESLEDAENVLLRKPSAASVRRQPTIDEDEIRTKPILRRDGGQDSFVAPSEVEDGIESRRGSGSPLTAAARGFMEPRFGVDFGSVRVHSDADSHSLNRELSARAFTIGSDVFFGRGEYSPDSEGGRRLLAHELSHVVQQNGASLQRFTGDCAACDREGPVRGVLEDTRRPMVSRAFSVANVPVSQVAAPSLVQLHHMRTNWTDKAKDDVIIYEVVEKKSNTVEYVGQTCKGIGINKRFSQHRKKKPWTKKTHIIRQRDRGKWTQFEACCFEQWYIEKQGSGGMKYLPYNKINAVTKKKFTKYKKHHKNLPYGWSPSK